MKNWGNRVNYSKTVAAIAILLALFTVDAWSGEDKVVGVNFAGLDLATVAKQVEKIIADYRKEKNIQTRQLGAQKPTPGPFPTGPVLNR